MPDDSITAALDEIREHWGKAQASNYHFTMAASAVPRLLAALDEVLKLPERWRGEAASLRDMAGRVYEDDPDAPGIALKHARASGLDDAAKALEHVARALLGKHGS